MLPGKGPRCFPVADKEEFAMHSAHNSLIKEFFEKEKIIYADDLIIKDLLHVQKRSAKLKLTVKQKWQGTYFYKEIVGHIYPQISIQKVSKQIGYGIFAEKEIPPNTYVGEYTGLIRKRKLWEKLENCYLFEYDLDEWVISKFIIDAKNHGNHTRYINHSDTPNLEPLAVVVEGTLRIILYTTKKIAIGEQLCYDYGEGYWNRRIKLSC